jgi:hypothetical protein
MAGGLILKAAANLSKQARGSHPSQGHSHQVNMVAGGNGSTTVVGINSNSILLQVQKWARKGTGSGILFAGTGGTNVDATALVTGVGTVAGKLVHAATNWTTSLLLVSWDQPDA